MYRTSCYEQQPESIWSCMRRSARAREEGSRVGRLPTRARAAEARAWLPRVAVMHAARQRRAAAAAQPRRAGRSAGRSALRWTLPPVLRKGTGRAAARAR